ncbi:MAG TPA: hypothetical protein VGB37_17460 [Candidatus Lokiarchaeia archaeon]
MIYSLIAPMGGGKTLFATLFALDYSIRYPEQPIFANYHLKLSKFHFNPFILLPFSELEKCLIICDDFYALHNAEGLIEVIVCYSRKRSIDIVITTQYYTDIALKIRTLSDYIIQVKYVKENDVLRFSVLDKLNIIKKYEINNAVAKIAKIYDTNEIVKFPSERILELEVEKNSHNVEDLETNCAIIYPHNSAKRNKLFNKIREKMILK